MFNLPGPQRFFKKVVEDLADSKHVILIMPTPLHTRPVARVLNNMCIMEGLGNVSEANIGPDSGKDIHKTLVESIAHEATHLPTVKDILKHTEAESRYFILRDGFKGGEERAKSFSRLLSRIEQETKSLSGEIEIQFIALASPGDQLPASALHLAIHPWWGVLGELDIETAMEEQLLVFPPENWFDHYWIRSLCCGLAQGEPDLAKRIVEDVPYTLEDVISILDGYNQHREARISIYLPIQNSLYGEPCSAYPIDSESSLLWRYGFINWISGIGHYYHSSMLTNDKSHHQIKRRIWQGQQKIMWPVVEQVRLVLISRIAGMIGNNWARHIEKATGVDALSLETELGPLQYALNKYQYVSRIGIPKQYVKLAGDWKDVRNKLAHGDMLTYNLMKKALVDYRSFRGREG